MLLTFFFTACEYKEPSFSSENKEFFYPSEERFTADYEYEEIHIDSVNNYAQLYKRMEKSTCAGKAPVVKFEHNGQSYNIIGYVGCPEASVVACYFRVNHIYITSNSIVYDYDKKIPVESLDDALSDLSSDPYKYEFNSTSLKKAVIWFYVDEIEPIKVTKELLIKITGEFEKINKKEKDKFPYYINFLNRQYNHNPPPPPPPSNGWEEIE